MELRRWMGGVGRAAIGMALLMPLCVPGAYAQDAREQGGGRGQFAGMQRVTGLVTGITGSQVTIKSMDGVVYQVVTTDNTRIMRERGVPGKLTDLKTGDGLMAAGNLDAPNKTMHAAIVISIEAEVVKRMEEQHKEELASLGKTMILGRVTAIDMDNATMTVERPDGVAQTIGFDEGTSFRRGRPTFMFGATAGGTKAAPPPNAAAAAPPAGESITLADIKVGDRVTGPGELKNGKFTAKELTVITPGAGRRRAEDSAAGASGQTRSSTAPQPASPSPK